MDQLRLEYTLLNEKLRQRDTDLEMYKTRLLDVERRQRDRSREVGRLNRENDEMRKQLESLTAISNY
jgi:chromosome segregation ATPase